MAVYLIGYDLLAPGKNYEDLYKEIKSLGDWCHALKSEWLVDTKKASTEIRGILKSKMDGNDLLLVSAVTSDYAGWLKNDAVEWLTKRVS